MNKQNSHKVGFDIFKDLKPLEIDWAKKHEENQKNYDQAVLNYNKAVEEEKERFKKLKCPVCKSESKKEVCHSESNGVIGPGYHSHVIFEYLICEDCGVMYKDLNKPAKIKYPTKGYL